MPHFDFVFCTLFAQGQAPAERSFIEQFLGSPIVPIIMVLGLLFFMLIMPERKQRERLKQQQAGLKKNDKVVIAGGIYGVVVEAPKEGERIKVRVDENNNTTLRVMRSSVLQVIDDEKPSIKKEAEAAPPSEK